MVREKEKIFIANDEEPIRILLKRHLGELGYEVIQAMNGREALS